MAKVYENRFETVNGVLEDQGFYIEMDGKLHHAIKPGHRLHDQMLAEVAAGEATTIVVDITPVPTVDELRIAAYGSVGDQLDMQYKDAINGTTEWVDHIAKVKGRFVKNV
jgi:hypothetical protein